MNGNKIESTVRERLAARQRDVYSHWRDVLRLSTEPPSCERDRHLIRDALRMVACEALLTLPDPTIIYEQTPC